MVFPRLLRRSIASRQGEALYFAAYAHARNEGFYTRLHVPDTVSGRFELQTLHIILLLERLRLDGAALEPLWQALFDAYLSNLDAALREMGVGDLAVGKRMRGLGEAFYGRAAAFDRAIAALPDKAEVTALLHRTVLAGDEARPPLQLTDYVLACRDSLRRCETADFQAATPRWIVP